MARTLAGGCRVWSLKEGRPRTIGRVKVWNRAGRRSGAKAISLRVMEFAPGVSELAGSESDDVLYALKQAGAREIHLWNRTPARAEALAEEFGASIGLAPADIVVNTTSVGLRDPEDTFKALPLTADELGAGCTVVDMVYRNGGTLLLNTAKANGADVVDGLEILVAQGAASLERWTGRTAPDQAMREAVADIAR